MTTDEFGVVLDLFGVVFSKGLESSIRELEVAFNRTEAQIAPVYRRWETEFDLGCMNEKEFWQHVNFDLGTNVEPTTLSDIVLSNYRLNEDAIKLVRRLRQSFVVMAYSNYRREWFDKLDSAFHISQHFRHVFLSSDFGLLKPDPRVLHVISEKTSIPIQSLLLIDDRLDNVRSAIKNGAKGVLFKTVYEAEISVQRLLGAKRLPYDEYYSGIIIETSQGTVVLQRRDKGPAIAHPGMLTVFGGRKLANEDPSQCALRELREETGLVRRTTDLEPVGELSCPIEDEKWMHCSFFVLRNVNASEVKLGEGERVEVWWPKEVISQPDLTPVTRTVLSNVYGSHLDGR